MTNADWKLKARETQLEVFNTLTAPFQSIRATDSKLLTKKVGDIVKFHLKTNKSDRPTTTPNLIGAEILKHSVGKEVNFSFVLIVTDIEVSGNVVSKMPIFVVISGNKRIFIDMNLTHFNSWGAFLKNNDLPSCEFCFPVKGHYNIGGELEIAFAPSPASLAVMENINIFWKGLGFFAGLGMVACSFFYAIPPVNHRQRDSLMSIASDFALRITGSLGYIRQGLNIVQRIRNGYLWIERGMSELYNVLKWLTEEFKTGVSSMFCKVRDALSTLYRCIGTRVPHFFLTASEASQHMFVAVTSRVDSEIRDVESETEELLEASRINNCRDPNPAKSNSLHSEEDAKYTDIIFERAKIESALQSQMKKQCSVDDEILSNSTLDLLSISNSLAKTLGKETLNDVQDIFEALSEIVKCEYKNKIEFYTKTLRAAKAGAGHKFYVESYNKELGFEGDPKDHYWKEAMMAAMETRLAYSIKDKVVELVKQKKILILEIWKKAEDDVAGLYRCVGVHGAGKFTANDLIKALKNIIVDLSEDKTVISEQSSVICIRTGHLTIAANQELNSENTAEGTLLIDRMGS